MSVHEIVTRLKSLSEQNRSLIPRISTLAKLSSSQETEETEEGEPLDRIGLSTEIHASLKEIEDEFELVKQEAEDITTTGGNTWSSGARRANEDRDRERVSIAGQVERLNEDLKLARAQFRKAQLSAKRNSEAKQRREREQLFAGVQDGNGVIRSSSKKRGQEKLSEEDILVNASSDVTAALRRTHQLMSSELARSQFAHETLSRSTAALRSLNESYSNIDTLLTSSKSLVSTLVSSSKSDTWYLETAFWILVYTLVWLVFRRVFYGPVRYLAFLPTKWLLKIFLSILQVFAGVFASKASGDGTGISAPIASPQVPLSEIPLGKREGRANPALPKHQIHSKMSEPAAKGSNAGDKPLSEKIASLADKKEDPTTDTETVAETDPDVEAEAEAEDEEWTAPDDEEEKHEDHGTVLRDPEPEETPNPKKRMWEEPIDREEADGHDEL